MDKSTSACANFYQFANGTWLKNTEVPAAYSSWGSFYVLAENNRKTLHDILEETAKNTKAAKGSNEQKIGDFYASCLDEARREAEGMKPLAAELARIDKIKDIKDVQAQIAYMHRHGIPTLFGFGSLPDLKNSSMVMAFAGQGGLSLPNRDYYTKSDEKSVKLREDFCKKNFDERAECIVNQFNDFEAEPGLHLQGKLVSGESIADLGGLYVPYDAFQKSLQSKPRPADIDGFAPEQRFFLGWAQVWAEKYTPEAARLQAQSDPHPLSRFRVNGPLSNMPKFAEAFQCKVGDAMVREGSKRCQIW